MFYFVFIGVSVVNTSRMKSPGDYFSQGVRKVPSTFAYLLVSTTTVVKIFSPISHISSHKVYAVKNNYHFMAVYHFIICKAPPKSSHFTFPITLLD